MKLRDLDAAFLKYVSPSESRMVDSLAEADGVMFQCPKCAMECEPGEENGRRFFRGAHSVICWFVGKVPDDHNPKPGRWTPSGTGIDDLTFVPGNPERAVSVLLTGPGCGWHGHIRSGEATLD
jgi:hypothetical protein